MGFPVLAVYIHAVSCIRRVRGMGCKDEAKAALLAVRVLCASR